MNPSSFLCARIREALPAVALGIADSEQPALTLQAETPEATTARTRQ